jgi:hypothetical protein
MINQRLKRAWQMGAVSSLIAILSLVSAPVAYAAEPLSLCTVSWVYSNDDGSIGKPTQFPGGIDIGDNGYDPVAIQTAGSACRRYPGNVAGTSAAFTASTVTLKLNNAYPGYYPTIFFGISNRWSTPGYIQSISIQNPGSAYLNPGLSGISINQVINTGTEIVGAFSIGVGTRPDQVVPEKTNNEISVTIVVTQLVLPGQEMKVNTVPLPNGQLNNRYQQALSAARGNPPYTWSVVSGSLPTGMTLSTSGNLTGIPNAAGTYLFAVQAIDVTGDKATANLSFTVPAIPANTPPSKVSPGSVGSENPYDTSSPPAPSTPAANLPSESNFAPGVSIPSGPPINVVIFAQLPGQSVLDVPVAMAADSAPVKTVEPGGIISLAPDSSQVKDAEPELPAKLAQAPFNWNVIIFIMADLVLIYVLYLLIFKRKLKK